MNSHPNLSKEELKALINKGEEIVLSFVVKKKSLNKIIHKIRQIILLISNKSIYNINDSVVERTLKFDNIIGVTISNSSDEFIVHAINDEYDCLYISPERKKIIAALQNAFKAEKGKDLLFCKKDSKDLDKFVVKKRERHKKPLYYKIKDSERIPIADYVDTESSISPNTSSKEEETNNQNNSIPQPPPFPPSKPPQIQSPQIVDPKVSIDIYSEIFELYSKTKVTQEFINENDLPLELKIYIYKNKNIIFDSFTAKIGDSIEVKSKIIKKEKAEIKYSDSIASGNAAIFVNEDPDNNRLIINMGNIPPKEKVVFTTKFLSFINSSNQFEFELFRNFPIFIGKQSIYQNIDLKGKIKIISKNKISNIQKEILMNNLEIKEEKFQNDKKMNIYLILYEIKNLPKFSFQNLEYIPSSKIYFNIDLNYPIIYSQDSLINSNEKFYSLRYKYNSKKDEEQLENNPGLFIFLIDQSGSMSGTPINIASKALKLFLQSLPSGSYYQIIGFGSKYKLYDEETPIEYKKENIIKTLKIIENLKADLGGTDIYSPLKYVYDSYKIHDKINLPRYIFLLTDGEVCDKNSVLNIIEENNSNYNVYSIGIGNYFDEDLIKNAGIIGKGNYNFCRELTNLNSIIVSEINRAVSNYIMNINIETSLDKKNIIKNNKIKSVIRENEIINLNYIINNKNHVDNINVKIDYIESDKKPMKKEYKIPSEYLEKGEELSKLIINDYLLNNLELSIEEKIKLALKYQIFTEYTSLFAEINLTKKISENMKLKIIGDKENNIVNINREIEGERKVYSSNINNKNFLQNALSTAICCRRACLYKHHEDDDDDEDDWDDDWGYSNSNSKSEKKEEKQIEKKEEKQIEKKEEKQIEKKEDIQIEKKQIEKKEDIQIEKKEDIQTEKKEEKQIEKKEDIQIEKVELTGKENVMKMIDTQDFIDGHWEENPYTKIIKEKYKNEYDLLKNKKIDDKVAITILVILYIYKEHKELMSELLMIIKKAKIYIQKEANNSYENIIKEIIFD